MAEMPGLESAASALFEVAAQVSVHARNRDTKVPFFLATMYVLSLAIGIRAEDKEDKRTCSNATPW